MVVYGRDSPVISLLVFSVLILFSSIQIWNANKTINECSCIASVGIRAYKYFVYANIGIATIILLLVLTKNLDIIHNYYKFLIIFIGIVLVNIILSGYCIIKCKKQVGKKLIINITMAILYIFVVIWFYNFLL